jgi:hypothetical protein
MIFKLTAVVSPIVQRFGRWRLVFLFFLIAYTALLLLYLDYAGIRWDETPHLLGGLLLSRGQIQEYSQEYLFYPPLFDATTALYYIILGARVFSVRLVALTFGILLVWTVFEYAYRVYGPRNALLSSILLASMPGFLVLCRVALIETMLMFFFSTSLFLFFLWTRTKNRTLLILSVVAVGIGVIAKYQALVSSLVMLVSLLFMWRKRIRQNFGKILLIAIIAVAAVLPLLFFVYQQFASKILGDWLYAIQVGNEQRASYSGRFPFLVFYLIEMTHTYSHIHPISAPLYILALLGLGLWLWRRRAEDKFSLIWFFVVYGVFTLIPNKDWRYVTPVFPILAISTSDFILFMWDKVKEGLNANKIRLHRMSIRKLAAAVFVLVIGTSVVYSWGDAHSWVKYEHNYIAVKETTQYVIENSSLKETTVVLFAENFFSADMVKFYLYLQDSGERELWSYPENPADAYSPSLNVTWLIERCEATNVKFLLLYEHNDENYYDSDWKAYYVLDRLVISGRFIFEAVFGDYPHRVIIIRFMPNS